MRLFSAFYKVRVNAIKPLLRDDEKIVFLMSTIDGFKIRRFDCILFYTVSVNQSNEIKKAVENINSIPFYTKTDKSKKTDNHFEIDTKIGRISVHEFSEVETELYGKVKNWSNLPYREPVTNTENTAAPHNPTKNQAEGGGFVSERFIDSESVPFVYDNKSNKLWRMEGDKRVLIPMTKSSAAITLSGMPISEERAKELAEAMLE